MPPELMRPRDVEAIGDELAIVWADGSESYLPLRTVRENCPCAACKGEVDVLGNLHRGPPRQLGPDAFWLRRIEMVGGYGIQPVWADGHSSGIFPFDFLKRLADKPSS